MSGKRKLQHFAEMKTFSNVFEVGHHEVFNKKYERAGHWNEHVFQNEHPIVLELGCGKGEYTLGLSKNYPDINVIGVDIKGARMWRGAKTALEENIGNARFLRTRIEFIDSFFGENEVSEIWITFPDPQLRESREKKRLTSPRFLEKYSAFLKNDGVVHLKTDSRELYEYSLEVFESKGYDVLVSTGDLYAEINDLDLTDLEKKILRIPTHYEQLFSEKGHIITYIKVQISQHG